MTSLGDTTGEPYVACLKKATCENVIISVNFFCLPQGTKTFADLKYSFRVNSKYLV